MSLLEEDFRFLETEFGLSRRELPDGYSYVSDLVTVYVRMWEESWVGVDRVLNPLGKPGFGLPIWALMNVRRSRHLYNDANKSPDKFPIYAAALRECCGDLLVGDFSKVQPVLDWLDARVAKQDMWEKSVLRGSDDA